MNCTKKGCSGTLKDVGLSSAGIVWRCNKCQTIHAFEPNAERVNEEGETLKWARKYYIDYDKNGNQTRYFIPGETITREFTEKFSHNDVFEIIGKVA